MNRIVLPPYMESRLHREETPRARGWFERLRPADRENAFIFLNGSYLWTGEMHRDNPEKYFVMSAVGSTLTKEGDYRDIDLMLVSNSDFEGVVEGGNCRGLAAHLRNTHHVAVASLGPDGPLNSIYGGLLQNFPGRKLLTIVPQQGAESPWRKIHLIVQPNAQSEADWDEQDRFLKLPLFRI